MFSKLHFNRGMNNVLPIHSIPAGYASYIRNLVPDGKGWEHIGDVTADITLPQTYTKSWQWFPPYTVTGADTSTDYVFIGFRGSSCYLVYKATGTGTWTETSALFTGVSVADVRVAFDNIQFLFVDGRDNSRAKRIMINDDGSIYAGDKGMESGYIFPQLVSLTYDDDKDQGTGIGQGGIYGWCVAEVNEFGEEGLPTPWLWEDTFQWQRRGEIDSEGDYLYDSLLKGSLKSATIRHTVSSANARRLILYRCDAYASESKQPVTLKRMVRSVTLSDGITAGSTVDINDSYPYGQIELDLGKDSSAAGDNITLHAGTAFVSNACKQFHYPVAIERIIAMTLSNPNDRHYVKQDVLIDLYDEVICGDSQNHLPNFYWETPAETMSGTNWTLSIGNWVHTPGAGNTQPLASGATVTSGVTYTVNYTIAITSGELNSITMGGVTFDAADLTDGTHSVTVTTTGTEALTFTPKADFDGSIKVDVTIYKDGATVYSKTKTRLLDTDFITPLKVHLYPQDAEFTYGDGTVFKTRRFARITIPEMPAGQDKVIYLVCSTEALPADYPNEFVEMADQDDVQDMYSALTCNPVRSEDTMVCCSEKVISDIAKWSNYHPLYYAVNKANINFSDDTSPETDTVNNLVPFDPMFQGESGSYSTTYRPFIEDTFMREKTTSPMQTLTYTSPSIFMSRKGFFYFWFSFKIQGAPWNIDILKLSENTNEPYVSMNLSEYDAGGGDWQIRLTTKVVDSGSATISDCYVDIPNNNVTNAYGRFFVLGTYENVISPDGVDANNQMKLGIAVLDELSSDSITRIFRLSYDTGGGTDAYKIFGTDTYKVEYQYGDLSGVTTFDLRTSHLFVEHGTYLGDLTNWQNLAYQFSRFLPFFPVEYIGADYTQTSDNYHNIENVAYEELSVVNDTRPGKIAWENTEQNTYKEIIAIKPMPSLKEMAEHGVILGWTKNDSFLMPLDGVYQISPFLPNIGLDSADLICDIPGGVAWKYQNDIHVYTTSGHSVISRDEYQNERFKVGTTFPTDGYMIPDGKTGRIWLVDNTNTLSYVYDSKTDAWLEAKLVKSGGYVQPLSFLQDGSMVAYGEAATYKKGTGVTAAAYLYTNSLGRKLRRYRVLGNLNNSITIGAEVYFSNLAQAYEQMTYNSAQWTQSGEKYTHVTGNTGTLIGQFIPTVGLTYMVKYTIGTIPAGAITSLTFGGDTTTLTKTAGTYSLEVTASTVAPLVLTPGSTFTGYIENIIIYEKDGGQHIAGVSVNLNSWSSLPGLKGDDIALLLSGITALEAIEIEDNQ